MPLFIFAFIVKSLLPHCLRRVPLPRRYCEFGLLAPSDWMKLLTFSVVCSTAAYRVISSCFQRNKTDLRKQVKRSFSFSQIKCQVINTRDIAPGTKFCRCLKSKDFPYCDGSHNVFTGTCDGEVQPLVVSHRLLRNFPKAPSSSSQLPQYTNVENPFELFPFEAVSSSENSEQVDYYHSPYCSEESSCGSYYEPPCNEECNDLDDFSRRVDHLYRLFRDFNHNIGERKLNCMPCSAKHQQQDDWCDFDSLESRLAATRSKIEDLWGVFDSKDSEPCRRVEGIGNINDGDSRSSEDFSFMFN